MKPLVLTAVLAMGAMATSPAAHAANARNPYGNVDRRVDAGNETGNRETDRLNDMQLQGSRGGGYPPPGYYPEPPPPPRYYAPRGYYPPPPRYYPPPGYYRPY